MATVEVEFDQSDLRHLTETLPKLAQPALEHIVARAAPYTRDQARANAPRLTGMMASSIQAEVHGMDMTVSSPLARAAVAEFGRAPGGKMPPVSAFAARGEFAFAIARAIAKRGTKGRFFMKRARQMLANYELPRLVSVAAREIEQAWNRL